LPARHYPVAIVGGGPTGLTLANLLGVYGVETIVLERNAEIPEAKHDHVVLSLDDGTV